MPFSHCQISNMITFCSRAKKIFLFFLVLSFWDKHLLYSAALVRNFTWGPASHLNEKWNIQLSLKDPLAHICCQSKLVCISVPSCVVVHVFWERITAGDHIGIMANVLLEVGENGKTNKQNKKNRMKTFI